MIQFYLDGQLVTTPDGWEDLKSKVKRDEQLRAVLIFQEASVQFTGDGYDYLYSKLLNEGFCAVVDLEVMRSCDENLTWKTLFKGRIFVSDVEFNERSCKATAKLEDNSFYSLIKNNAKIKTALDTDLTKNGEPLTQAPVYEVDFYSVPSNAAQTLDVPCIRVYDAFKYLVSFMTDNRVQFESALFDVGGRWEGLCITTGERIRTATDSEWLQISFNQLFTEVYNATEPLVMVIENPYSTTPTIRIEDDGYSYASTINLICGDVYEVRSAVEQEKLYTSLTVGSSIIDDTSGPNSFPELIDFFGFKSEQLYVTGECNIDNSLELTGEFIRSSNIIWEIVNPLTQVQDHDLEFFIINTILSSTTSGRTTNENVFNELPAKYYYNAALRNSEILERWTGGLPNNLVKYVGVVGDGLFEAVSAADQFPSILGLAMDFANEAFDNGNNWVTNTYTAPETGVFYFDFIGSIAPNAPSVSGVIDIRVKIYDSSGNFKYDAANRIIQNINGAVFFDTATLGRTFRAVMNATDYAQLRIRYAGIGGIAETARLFAGAVFKCTQNTIGGAAFNTYDPSEYPVFTYTFDYPLTDDDFDVLVANPIGRIGFAMENQAFRYGWIKDITYNHVSKLANIKLISSQSDAT